MSTLRPTFPNPTVVHDPTPELPPTTIIVPTLNEVRTIRDVIASLLPPDAPFVREVIVADGLSEDGTAEAVEALSRTDPRIRLLHNPARVQSAAINRAAQEADPLSEVILRADAHSTYPPDFVTRVVSELVRTGADSVVVRMESVGTTCFQKAVAAVSNSVAGTGGSAHRMGGASGFVEHGHHAAFWRSLFLDLGGYQDQFVPNEDAEFDARLRAAGGKIWFAGDLTIGYHPRATPAALAKQYWRYGRARAQTFLRHRERLRLRQIIPPLAVLTLAASILVAPIAPAFLAVPTLYLATTALVGIVLAVRGAEPCLLAAPLALSAMHLSWGAGFLWTLARRSVWMIGTSPKSKVQQ